jgi:hypothetical protein
MPLVIVTIIMELLLRQIPNIYTFKKNKLEENSDKIEILFLGNSHAFFGLNPDYMTKCSFNAAHVSQTFDYDLEILRKYKDRWSRLKYIVLPVSYFSLYDKLSESPESWRVKDYCIYYKITVSRYLPNYTEMLNGQLLINCRRLWSYYIKKMDNISCTESGWGTSYRISKPSIDLSKAGKSAAGRHRRTDDQYFEEVCSTLDSIIIFAEKRNIRLVLFTPPAFESYRDNLNMEQLERTVQTVINKTKSNVNCTYINLLDDKSFVNSDFYDPDHLNENGARKLTQVINNIINNKVDSIPQ